jgi:anti-sigma regulatory factor (Ser/Thr protein kinase)
MNELLVKANTENLDSVLSFIEESCECLAPSVMTLFLIAAEEIFVNIANYAYGTGDGDVKITTYTDDELVTVEFHDTGIAYNPTEHADPDVTLSADEREIGGLGLLMVKKIADEFSYERKGNENILIVRKKYI